MALGDFLENLNRNVGGLGGGLMAAGQSMSVMAQALGSGRRGESAGAAWGRALGAGTQALQQGFMQQKERKGDRDFMEWATGRAEDLPEGSAERQVLEAVGKPGSGRYLKLLPSLMAAQARDAGAGGGGLTKEQLAKNRLIDADRQSLARYQGLEKNLELESVQALIASARRAKVGLPDPDHTQWHDFAVRSSLSALRNKGIPEVFPNLDPETGQYVWGRPDLDAQPEAAEAIDRNDIPFVPGFLEPAVRGIGSFFGGGEATAAPPSGPPPEGSLESELRAALGGNGAIPAQTAVGPASDVSAAAETVARPSPAPGRQSLVPPRTQSSSMVGQGTRPPRPDRRAAVVREQARNQTMGLLGRALAPFRGHAGNVEVLRDTMGRAGPQIGDYFGSQWEDFKQGMSPGANLPSVREGSRIDEWLKQRR